MLKATTFGMKTMYNLWKQTRGLAANRTGVPASHELEDDSFSESRRGSWIVVLAVALAFALVLQMETERRQANFIPPVPVDAS